MRASILVWFGLVVLLTACARFLESKPAAPPSPATPAQSAAAPVAAMTRVKAGRGETCSQYVRWCVEWCTKNMAGSQGCLDGCQKRGETCLVNGEWVIEAESRIVTNLPPR